MEHVDNDSNLLPSSTTGAKLGSLLKINHFIMKKIYVILFALFLTSMALVTYVRANPPTFLRVSSTNSAASTSPVYLRVNTTSATSTTPVYDAYALLGTGEVSGNLYVSFGIQLKASSTATVLAINPEYSNDGIDWYQDNFSTYAAGAIAIATRNSYTWTYASTTVGGAAVLGNTDTGAKIIQLPVPTRYVRLVSTISGANGAIWIEALGIKQR
jgi:hypothetical protein